MSNNITSIATGTGRGILAGPHHGLKTTLSVSNNTVANGTIGQSGQVLTNTGFSFTQPPTSFKAGTVTIKGEGNEEAEFDAAFINDLKLLLEVINDLPDQHPMGDLKHDMRMRRAFKRLGG